MIRSGGGAGVVSSFSEDRHEQVGAEVMSSAPHRSGGMDAAQEESAASNALPSSSTSSLNSTKCEVAKYKLKTHDGCPQWDSGNAEMEQLLADDKLLVPRFRSPFSLTLPKEALKMAYAELGVSEGRMPLMNYSDDEPFGGVGETGGGFEGLRGVDGHRHKCQLPT